MKKKNNLSKKPEKIKAKDRYGKTIIYIRIDNKLLDLISVLRDFYGYSTRNSLFPYLIILSVLEIASFSPSPKWTKEKKNAFKKTKKYASSFGQALALTVAKSVLKKQKPDTLLTVHELGNKVKKELKDAVKP